MNKKYDIRVFDLKEDKKVRAKCLLTDITIWDYIELIENNLENLPLQRGKVISRKSEVYDRLKEDLKNGTIIPPISLIANKEFSESIRNVNDTKKIEDIINDKINKNSLSILDGLQRTYCILNAIDDLKDKPGELEAFKNLRIRAELWYSIQTNALLYKVLVLNTGQFKMSMRHQLEILYVPIKEKMLEIAKKNNIENLKFSTYRNNFPSNEVYQYKFSDILEGLTAFSACNPIVDKTNIVVAELEKLQFIKEHSDTAKLASDEELEEFSNLLFALDKKLWEKYEERLSQEDPEGNKKPVEWTSRNDFMHSAPFLSGFFASFGKFRKEDKASYETKKKELLTVFDKEDEDPLKLMILSEILEKEKAVSKKFGTTVREFFFRAFNEFFRGETNLQTIWMHASRG